LGITESLSRMNCWAASLGDCAGGTSGEHYVSDGVLDSESVTAIGLPWCRDEPKTIGLKSAVAHILCSKHNSDLSPFDSEASKLSKFLVKSFRDPHQDHTITLNGYLFEKWVLKTFLNLGYLRALHREQSNSLVPPESLVRYIYKGEGISDGIGLYHVSGTIGPENLQAGVFWNSIRTAQRPNVAVGLTMRFYGIRFVVTIDARRSEEAIRKMGIVDGFDFTESIVTYRPNIITLNSLPANQKHITLRW
jgi:hypothetical protein